MKPESDKEAMKKKPVKRQRAKPAGSGVIEVGSLASAITVEAVLEQRPLAAGPVKGYVDRCDVVGVEGWAAREGSSEPIEVEVWADALPVANGVADIFRNDLRQAGVGDGTHGFRVILPNSLFDGAEHAISVRERASGIVLDGSPKPFRSDPQANAGPADAQASPSGSIGADDADAGLGSGFIDHVQDGYISGWYFSGVPGHFQKLHIHVDGQHAAEVVADQYRTDLERAGLNNGVCSFVWLIPESLRDEKDHVVAVRTPEGKDLNRSPVVIKGFPSEQAVSETRRKAPAAEDVDLANLFVNPDLEGLNVRRRDVAIGPNPIAEGWELFAGGEDVGQVAYWHSIRESQGSESIANALRIKSKRPLKVLRLFGSLSRTDCFFFAPFTLAFHLSNHSKTQAVTVNLRIGPRTAEGRIEALFRARIVHGPGASGMVSLSVPADAVNRMVRLERFTPAVLVEFSGDISIDLSDFRFGLGARSLELQPHLTGIFEDPAIQAQAEAAKGFFEIGVTRTPAVVTPVWRAWPGQHLPEVVVPVFDALEHVRKCLESVVEHTECPHMLTVVDDGSFPECGAWLDSFAQGKPWVKVLHNARNAGYTLAVNRAIRETSGSAIVLLNSDAIVSTGWLTRLLAVAESDPKIGLVGPLSNAASWQSVPEIKGESGAWAVNVLPPRMSVSDYADAVRLASSGDHPEVPILNGFCLLIKRQVFDTIGLFDEEAFPQGFGEENDFCFRAADAGFTLRVVTDAYVYHAKSKSFGSKRRDDLSKRADVVLRDRYGKERFEQLGEKLSNLPALEAIRAKLLKMNIGGEQGNG